MKKHIFTLVMLMIISILVGCEEDKSSNQSQNHINNTKINYKAKLANQLPSVQDATKIIEKYKNSVQEKVDASDMVSITSEPINLLFAYYTANSHTSEGLLRWYISATGGSLSGYIFSLGDIETINGTEKVSWREVSSDAASVNLETEKVVVGNIADNPTHTFMDWGLGVEKHYESIQEDIELIRNTTVNVRWWFFQAPNGSWYIIDKAGHIYKFETKDGQYDWQVVDTANADIEFYMEGGVKRIKVELPNAYSLEEGNHALMGPLKNATVEIYKLNDLENKIEETQTNNLGKFELSLNNIINTELLLVSIGGGSDIDANDDGKRDDTPTPNDGIIHGFAKASELRSGNVNITLLSEIVYQYTKHLIGKVHQADLEEAINQIKSQLLREEMDINTFVPMDRSMINKLDFNYTRLIEGDNSFANLYHNEFNLTKIEKKLGNFFAGKGLSLRNMRLEENFRHATIVLAQPIKSDISSTGTDIYIDVDENRSKLTDFVLKNTPITFTITPKDEVKILGWEGCDSLSDDLTICTVTPSSNYHKIVPNVVYKETQYADNVKDLTTYQIGINDTNYTVTLDLDANDDDKSLLNSIVVDDIIISTSSANPFFRKVTEAIKIDDNNYIFETSQASFLELYQQGSVFTNRNLTHEDLVLPSANQNQSRAMLYKPHNGMRLLPPKHKNDDEFVIVFGEGNSKIHSNGLGDVSGEITVPIKDGMSVKGSMSFKLKPEFNYNIEWLSLESMRLAITTEVSAKLVFDYSKNWAEDVNPEEFLRQTLASYRYYIPGTPILLNIRLDSSILVEGAVETSINVGGQYTNTTKAGFNYVNRNISIIYNNTGNGAFIGEMKPIQLSMGEYLKLSPKIIINEIAGAELQTKLGFYEEISPLALSFNNSDGDINFYGGKVDARFSAGLKWTWSNWLEDYDWAKKLGKDINKKIGDTPLGTGYVASFNLLEWSNQLNERPAYLQLTSSANTNEIKNSDESIDKHYVFNIKNTGEKKLKWKLEVTGDLSDDLSISPIQGELNEGEDIDVDIYLEINDLSSKIGKYNAYLKFINLSDTESSNAKTGTRTKKISLKAFEKIAPPSNLTASLIGESIKKIRLAWTKSITESVLAYKLYKTNYDEDTGSCYSSYINVSPLPNTEYFELPFSFFENHAKEEFKMEAGKKYCLKISAFKLNFDLDQPLSESDLSEATILEIPSYATLQSNITDKDNNPIENAQIYLTSISTNTLSDGTGNYTFENLMPGRYKIVVEAEGYIRIEAEVTLIDGEIKIFERQLVADEDLEDITGTVGGKVKNALNGSGIANATIDIRKGINVLYGEIVETISTDSSGNYSTTLKTGAYTFNISANGYTSHSETIYSYGNESTQKDLALSPILSEGNMRIVLGWGENPRDLDSHLVKRVNGSQEYHIYYGSKRGTNGDNLDHDDTSSYGPETVTINNVDSSAVYTYYVYHYSGSSNLKSSSAKVEVYYGNSSSTISVPNGDGRYWKVFNIVNGQIIPCTSNCIQNSNSSMSIGLNTDENEFSIFENLPRKD